MKEAIEIFKTDIYHIKSKTYTNIVKITEDYGMFLIFNCIDILIFLRA